MKGTQNPFVKQATQYGQQMHKIFDYGKGYEREKTLDSGKRIDGFNEELQHIKELKPDNAEAIRRGEKQLEGYLKELNEAWHDGWTGEVVTYPSLKRP
jgi:hypothetical protein